MSYCERCGFELEEGIQECPRCDKEGGNQNYKNLTTNVIIKEKMGSLQIIGLISVVSGIVFWIYGFYKMMVYDGENYVNSYVGGDAYNIIINAIYFTGFAVIGGTLIIVGVILFNKKS